MNIIMLDFFSPFLIDITILLHVDGKTWTSVSLRKGSFLGTVNKKEIQKQQRRSTL